MRVRDLQEKLQALPSRPVIEEPNEWNDDSKIVIEVEGTLSVLDLTGVRVEDGLVILEART